MFAITVTGDASHCLTVPTTEVLAITERTLEWFKSIIEKFREEIASFGNFPTLFLGIVKEDGGLTFYDSKIRVVNPAGDVVAIGLNPADYPQYIGEKVESWTYLKSPYYLSAGYPDGVYRVGPLARLNVADRCNTAKADQELAEFHELQRTAVLSSFHYHHARLIEILYCIERREQLLNDREILSKMCARSRVPIVLKVSDAVRRREVPSFTTTRLTSRD